MGFEPQTFRPTVRRANHCATGAGLVVEVGLCLPHEVDAATDEAARLRLALSMTSASLRSHSFARASVEGSSFAGR